MYRIHRPPPADVPRFQENCKVEIQGEVVKKVTGTFCRNGPSGASHKRCLSPYSPPPIFTAYRRHRRLIRMLAAQIDSSVPTRNTWMATRRSRSSVPAGAP